MKTTELAGRLPNILPSRGGHKGISTSLLNIITSVASRIPHSLVFFFKKKIARSIFDIANTFAFIVAQRQLARELFVTSLVAGLHCRHWSLQGAWLGCSLTGRPPATFNVTLPAGNLEPGGINRRASAWTIHHRHHPVATQPSASARARP